jgi:hypothetical protein
LAGLRKTRATPVGRATPAGSAPVFIDSAMRQRGRSTSFAGKLTDENTLAGSLSGLMGDSPWSAVRVKEQAGIFPSHSRLIPGAVVGECERFPGNFARGPAVTSGIAGRNQRPAKQEGPP